MIDDPNLLTEAGTVVAACVAVYAQRSKNKKTLAEAHALAERAQADATARVIGHYQELVSEMRGEMGRLAERVAGLETRIQELEAENLRLRESNHSLRNQLVPVQFERETGEKP